MIVYDTAPSDDEDDARLLDSYMAASDADSSMQHTFGDDALFGLDSYSKGLAARSDSS